MKLIEADFVNREVLNITDVESFPSEMLGGRVLMTRDNASREELIDQAATFAVAHNIAKAQGNTRVAADTFDLFNCCLDQVEATDREAVFILATQKLDDEPLNAS